MLLSIIFLVISIIGSVLTFIFYYYPRWEYIWVPFVTTIIYDLLLVFIFMSLVAIFSTIYQKTHKEASKKIHPFGMFIIEQASFIIFHLFQGRHYFSGYGKLPPLNQRFMLVSNHLSSFDHMGLFSLLAGRRLLAVSKKSNENLFGAGGWIMYAGHLAIDQNDMLSGKAVIERAGDLIKEGTCSIAICPEGTRNKQFPDPMMLPFKPGAFDMAMKAKCPIVVIAIQNTNAITPRFPRITRCYYDCVAVLEYEDYKDWTLSKIASYCHDRIYERLEKKQSRFYHVKKKQQKEQANQ